MNVCTYCIYVHTYAYRGVESVNKNVTGGQEQTCTYVHLSHTYSAVYTILDRRSRKKSKNNEMLLQESSSEVCIVCKSTQRHIAVGRRKYPNNRGKHHSLVVKAYCTLFHVTIVYAECLSVWHHGNAE